MKLEGRGIKETVEEVIKEMEIEVDIEEDRWKGYKRERNDCSEVKKRGVKKEDHGRKKKFERKEWVEKD